MRARNFHSLCTSRCPPASPTVLSQGVIGEASRRSGKDGIPGDRCGGQQNEQLPAGDLSWLGSRANHRAVGLMAGLAGQSGAVLLGDDLREVSGPGAVHLMARTQRTAVSSFGGWRVPGSSACFCERAVAGFAVHACMLSSSQSDDIGMASLAVHVTGKSNWPRTRSPRAPGRDSSPYCPKLRGRQPRAGS